MREGLIWRWNYTADPDGKQVFYSLTVLERPDAGQVDVMPDQLAEWKLQLASHDVPRHADAWLRATDPETIERLGIKL